MILEQINGPEELKALPPEDLKILAQEDTSPIPIRY